MLPKRDVAVALRSRSRTYAPSRGREREGAESVLDQATTTGDQPTTDTATSGGPDTEPVGDRLRAARVAAGLSLEQVSARTRIRVPVLRQLEDDQLGTAGTAVYTRGHLRAIAAAVGIDPAPLVRALDERVGASAPAALVPAPVPVPMQPAGRLSVPRSAPPERQQPRWLTACLAVLAVLVVLLGVGVLGDETPDRTDALLVPRAGTVAEPDPSPTVAPRPSAAAPAQAVLSLEASGPSWLSVRNRGGYPLFEGTVPPGWSRTFSDPKALTVRVGNAAAVAVSCAKEPAAAQGGEGTALTLRCTPQGLSRP